jgi:hypothetical protein
MSALMINDVPANFDKTHEEYGELVIILCDAYKIIEHYDRFTYI